MLNKFSLNERKNWACVAPFPPPYPFSFREVLFSGCPPSLLLHMVSFQGATSYLCPAKVFHQGAISHPLVLSLNGNTSLATLSKVDHPQQNYSLSQHPFGFFLHKAYNYWVICLLTSYSSLCYYCKTTSCQEAGKPLGGLTWSLHSDRLHFNWETEEARQTDIMAAKF